MLTYICIKREFYSANRAVGRIRVYFWLHNIAVRSQMLTKFSNRFEFISTDMTYSPIPLFMHDFHMVSQTAFFRQTENEIVAVTVIDAK